jgi:hypothetical protein
MVSLASALAVLLFAAPTAVFVAVRARPERRLWQIALDLPLGLSLDVLSVLALAWLLPLERAVLVSRALWLAAAAVGLPLARRAGRLGLPACLGRREAFVAGVAALVGVGASLLLSVPYAIWDRRWHTPLVASLRGQRLPFVNVYQPWMGLAYHFAGDVVGAMVQSLSLGTIHASLALSLAHDALFGMTGLFLGLFFLWLGARRATPVALAVAAVLLTGPLTLFRGGATRPSAGFSWFNYLSLSFRPHVVLAGLLLLGFFGAVLVRLRERDAAPQSTVPTLVCTTALLALSDEASLGLAGLSVGLLWLVRPDAIHPSRARGFGVLVALALALVGANLLFHGALAPGAPKQTVTLPPWRVPGVEAPRVLLPSAAGLAILAQDLWPLAAAWLGGALVVLRPRFRDERASFGLLSALSALSVVGLLRVEINHSAGESHRFLTAIALLAPLLAAAWLLRLGATGGRGAALASVLFVAGLALPAASTLEWAIGVAPGQCDHDQTFFTTEALRTVDCRAAIGGGRASPPVPEYVSRPVAYLYAGCRPVFSPGTETRGWALGVGFVEGGLASLRELDAKMLRPGEPVAAICPRADAAPPDPVCRYAAAHGTCAPSGSKVVRCTLSADDRRALLAGGAPRPAASALPRR